MSYGDKLEYPKKHPFTVDQLVKVTPTDLYKWLAFKVYKKEDPGPKNNPTFGQSSSMNYYKKTISYYMPHQLMH
jgi:hypothetical protein